MRLSLLVAAMAATLSFAGAAGAQPKPFAITNVRVFDGEKVISKAVVVVQDGRIVAVGPNVRVPAGAAVTDGVGKTLIPGLIDAHTHTFGAARADAIRFGVTTELDMFTHPATLGPIRRQREATSATAQADLFSAGVLATAPNGHGTEYGFAIPTLTGPAESDAWVAARIAEGSDYIKIVYAPRAGARSLDRATLEAVIRAAHARGRMAVVHIQEMESARAAIEAGADGLAHIFADTAGDAALYRLAAAKKVFVIPTLTVFAGVTGQGEGAKLAADPRVAPLLTAEQAGMLRQTFRPQTVYKFAVASEAVAAFRAAKVDVLAGTDAGNPSTTHGASMHQELALLVAAGLTPTEALRAATATPARRFRLEGRGRIAVGARADLVLVDGDPTADIAATRAIAAVWKNGYPVDRRPGSAKGPPPLPLTGLLGDFEAGLGGPGPSKWEATSDRIAGGASDAAVAHVTPGANGSKGALRASGEIKPPFPFAWGGAQLFVAASGTPPRDISGATALVFRVRGQGSGPQGRAMLFDTSSPQPKQRAFAFTPDWQEVRLPIASFQGLNAKAVVGFVIATDPTKGPYAFEVDDIRLE